MKYFPSKFFLKEAFSKGEVVPLAFEEPLRGSAFHLYQKVFASSPSVFLDSASLHPKTARFSFIAWDPFLVFRSKGLRYWMERKGVVHTGKGFPLAALRSLFRRYPARRWPGFPPFTSGAVGYFSYDLVRLMERLPHLAKEDVDVADIHFLFPRRLFAIDHVRNTVQGVTCILPDEEGGWEKAYSRAVKRLEEMAVLVHREVPAELNGKCIIRDFQSNRTPREFERMVEQARCYIRAGDIYQANLSQRFRFSFSGQPLRFYEALRSINPSPFSSFLDLGLLQIASSSPERLIRLRDRWCETRPIAGTRPRGKSAQEDEKLRRELFLNEKERAEHLMLVDLERNDLGRVCEYDSVAVDEFMTLEEYSHVIHIVSDVVGRLRPDRDQFDLIQAMFPGGTITGCPKIRCMQIIEELEPVRRGLYTGSIGYLDFTGDMDLNIVIRTLVLNRRCGYIQVGAGIVWDSNPEAEYLETVQKGKALFEALECS